MDNVISTVKIRNAMDLIAVMASEEIARHFGWTETKALASLLSSETGACLYNDDTKFWWMGPSAIAELFAEELNNCNP